MLEKSHKKAISNLCRKQKAFFKTSSNKEANRLRLNNQPGGFLKLETAFKNYYGKVIKEDYEYDNRTGRANQVKRTKPS